MSWTQIPFKADGQLRCFYNLGAVILHGFLTERFSNGEDKKERTTRYHEHVRMQKNAHFNIVSTTLLIGLNIKFLFEIFAKQLVYQFLCILSSFLKQKLVESKKKVKL